MFQLLCLFGGITTMLSCVNNQTPNYNICQESSASMTVSLDTRKCFPDVYGYDLEDKFTGETEKLNDIERNVYYRLRNLYLNVGSGKDYCIIARYDLPEPIAVASVNEFFENQCNFNEIKNSLQLYCDKYNYFTPYYDITGTEVNEETGMLETVFVIVNKTPQEDNTLKDKTPSLEEKEDIPYDPNQVKD